MELLCAENQMRAKFLVRFPDGATRWVLRDSAERYFTEIQLTKVVTWKDFT